MPHTYTKHVKGKQNGEKHIWWELRYQTLTFFAKTLAYNEEMAWINAIRLLESSLKLPEAWECNLILITNYKRVDVLLTYCTRGFCVQENLLWLGLFLKKLTFNAVGRTEQFQEP